MEFEFKQENANADYNDISKHFGSLTYICELGVFRF